MSDVEQRLTALTEADRVGPSGFYDAYERQLHAKLIFLGESKVHGIGVFAKRDLPKGACIGALCGPRVEMDAPGDRTYWFVHPDNGRQYMEELTGPLRFLNEGRANVVARRHNGRTRAFTTVDVGANTELLMDYKRQVESL